MCKFTELGKLDQARKIARKLIANDKARLNALSKVEINSDNYRAVMDELNKIEFLYKRGNYVCRAATKKYRA
ncbi:MAG: hypothetical protein DRH97_00020 [Chloroflexi bacterium]|nr:MAG: hypothetical protein DRH97_00020 [Chloroflexota bacterium]